MAQELNPFEKGISDLLGRNAGLDSATYLTLASNLLGHDEMTKSLRNFTFEMMRERTAALLKKGDDKAAFDETVWMIDNHHDKENHESYSLYHLFEDLHHIKWNVLRKYRYPDATHYNRVHFEKAHALSELRHRRDSRFIGQYDTPTGAMHFDEHLFDGLMHSGSYKKAYALAQWQVARGEGKFKPRNHRQNVHAIKETIVDKGNYKSALLYALDELGGNPTQDADLLTGYEFRLDSEKNKKHYQENFLPNMDKIKRKALEKGHYHAAFEANHIEYLVHDAIDPDSYNRSKQKECVEFVSELISAACAADDFGTAQEFMTWKIVNGQRREEPRFCEAKREDLLSHTRNDFHTIREAAIGKMPAGDLIAFNAQYAHLMHVPRFYSERHRKDAEALDTLNVAFTKKFTDHLLAEGDIKNAFVMAKGILIEPERSEDTINENGQEYLDYIGKIADAAEQSQDTDTLQQALTNIIDMIRPTRNNPPPENKTDWRPSIAFHKREEFYQNSMLRLNKLQANDGNATVGWIGELEKAVVPT